MVLATLGLDSLTGRYDDLTESRGLPAPVDDKVLVEVVLESAVLVRGAIFCLNLSRIIQPSEQSWIAFWGTYGPSIGDFSLLWKKSTRPLPKPSNGSIGSTLEPLNRPVLALIFSIWRSAQ